MSRNTVVIRKVGDKVKFRKTFTEEMLDANCDAGNQREDLIKLLQESLFKVKGKDDLKLGIDKYNLAPIADIIIGFMEK